MISLFLFLCALGLIVILAYIAILGICLAVAAIGELFGGNRCR